MVLCATNFPKNSFRSLWEFLFLPFVVNYDIGSLSAASDDLTFAHLIWINWLDGMCKILPFHTFDDDRMTEVILNFDRMFEMCNICLLVMAESKKIEKLRFRFVIWCHTHNGRYSISTSLIEKILFFLCFARPTHNDCCETRRRISNNHQIFTNRISKCTKQKIDAQREKVFVGRRDSFSISFYNFRCLDGRSVSCPMKMSVAFGMQ